MSKAVYGAITIWGIYGGVRGWNFYKKKNEEYPTLHPVSGSTSDYYIKRSCYAIAGVFYYTLPITRIFSYINEVYRVEIILRNMNNSKETVPYYNPFYPIYYSP